MIFALLSPKGGTGTTTLAFSLAHSKTFARRFKSIAVIDTDAQGSLARKAALAEFDRLAKLEKLLSIDAHVKEP